MAGGANRVAGQVGGDGENGTAGAAEDGCLVLFRVGPGCEGMVGQGVVTIFAGVEEAATFHFDGDDVEWGVIVEAAGLGIEIQAVDLGGFQGHRRLKEENSKRIAEGRKEKRYRRAAEYAELRRGKKEKRNAETQRSQRRKSRFLASLGKTSIGRLGRGRGELEFGRERLRGGTGAPALPLLRGDVL